MQTVCGAGRYQGQRQGHAAILARFEADLREISAIELHPAARTDALKRMSDLVPVDKLRDWVDHCQKGHDTFVEKVTNPQPETKISRQNYDSRPISLHLLWSLQNRAACRSSSSIALDRL